MTGKWLTPITVGEMAVWGFPKAMARSMQKWPTSWHRPTVLIPVSRHTDRVRAVIGLVMFSIQASAQHSSMSRPIPTRTGMLRSDRLIPPGPTLSPTDCRIP